LITLILARVPANGCARSSPRGIERPDRKLASGQRPPFIPVHSGELLRHVGKNYRQLELTIPLAQQCAPPGLGIAERSGEQIMARKPYATKINAIWARKLKATISLNACCGRSRSERALR
jgi:hypothetical protein